MKSVTRLLFESLLILTVATFLIAVPPTETEFDSEIRLEETTLESAQVDDTRASLSHQVSEAQQSPARLLSPSQPPLPSPGFTLVPEVGSAQVKLLDMEGTTVHRWEFDADRVRLLPNGNIVALHGSKWGLTTQPWSGLQNTVREYDWNGNLVWEHREPGRIHHDITVLPNGNFLTLHRLELPTSYSQSLTNPTLTGLRIRSDEIFEVNRRGEKVWSWKAHEHLDPNSCGKNPCPKKLRKDIKRGKKVFDWTHANTVSVVPDNRWFDSGDIRFRPGNVVTVLRNMSTIFIIDRKTSEVVWRYTGDHRGGLQYGHEAHVIKNGLPGAGNILVFDNGTKRLMSAILEINPVTKEIVWKYDVGRDFYSRVQGSVQRLPNGNTLISEDLGPRVFEVTPDGDTVWEERFDTPRIARAIRYPTDYCEQFKSLS